MLKIIKDKNPIMRKKSVEVSLPLSSEDKSTLDKMLDYLIQSQDEEYAEKNHIRSGVGLAAIQIGLLKRMFVVYFHDDKNELVQYQLVNPVIVEESAKKCALENGEGCLSVDKDKKGLAHRHYKIKMKAYDALSDKNIEIVATGYKAIVLQHEFDHLNGIFYYDRINQLNPFEKENNEVIL